MSRTRAFNRAKRFNARKRRRNLRSAVPSMRGDFHGSSVLVDHSEELVLKEVSREALLDLNEENF